MSKDSSDEEDKILSPQVPASMHFFNDIPEVEEPILALAPLPTLTRPLSPPLEAPKESDSSTFDSDSDDEELNKRLATIDELMHGPPPRPPSRVAEDVIQNRRTYPVPVVTRRTYTLITPDTSITLSPTLNKPENRREPFQEGMRAGMFTKAREVARKNKQIEDLEEEKKQQAQKIQQMTQQLLASQQAIARLQYENLLLKHTIQNQQKRNK